MSTQVQGLRLSPQQKRLWLLQYDRGVYVAQAQVSIAGSLHVAALQAAVQQVIDRHEILRTTFHRTPGITIPIQVILNHSAPSWQIVDISDMHEDEQAAQVEQMYRAERTQPFDFEQGPLVRVQLLVCSPNSHIMLICLPSLCADARTLRNFVTEVVQIYSASVQGGSAEPDLEPDIVQYADFSEWQHELLEGEDAEAGRRYWNVQQASADSVLSLPSERQAAEDAMFEPESFTTAIDSATTKQLEAFASSKETSVANVVLACWQTLLWRFTGEARVAVGTVFDGRSYEDLQTGFGLFARSIPIRSSFTDASTIDDILRQVDDGIAAAAEWQDYFLSPSDQPQSSIAPAQCMFAFDEQLTSYNAPGASFTLTNHASYLERFMVQVAGVRQETHLALRWDYDAARLPRAAVHALAEALITLLHALLPQPRTPLARLPLLTPAAHARLLAASAAPLPTASPVLLPHALEAQAARTPHAIALVAGRTELSYAALNAQANQLARLLHARGLTPDTPVAVLLPRSPALVVALLAILKAGGAYLPLDPGTPPERLALTLHDAAVPLLLTERTQQAVLPPSAPPVLLLDTLAAELADQPTTNLDLPIVPSQSAYVLFTSGSTGRPKGVVIPHQALAQYLAWAVPTYRIAEGRGAVVHAPVSFDLTVTSLWGPLVCGRSVVLVAEAEELEALGRALEAGADYSLVKLTPAHLTVVAQTVAAERLVGSTRALVIGGEALHGEQLTFWQRHAPETRLINEYGPTETVVGCCVYEVEGGSGSGAVPIGQAVPETQVYVLDRHEQPVAVGMAGELYIGGGQVGRGYLHRPELTAARFVPDPFSPQPGARMYRTGDLVRYLLDGNLEFLGRIDRQVKIRGYRIELEEIEAVLRQHPAVHEGVVMVREDNADDRRLVAYVVLDRSASTDDLHEFLSTQLPAYMVPAHIVALAAMPLTTNGKIDMQALPKPDSAPTVAYVAPRTALEAVLADMWTQLLGVQECGIYTSFFALGGHSLLAIQLMSRVQALFQIQLSMYAFFDAPTIAELADLIIAHESKPGQAETIARVQQRIKKMSADDKASMLQAIQRGEV